MSRALTVARENRDRAMGERDYQEREAQRLSGLLFAAGDDREQAHHG